MSCDWFLQRHESFSGHGAGMRVMLPAATGVGNAPRVSDCPWREGSGSTASSAPDQRTFGGATISDRLRWKEAMARS
ncbi:MAG: hypothetical protein CL812_12600 [Confluentimicrobium sp.]|nr:hypothetical protein [Actibacterium sp.]